MALQSVCTVHLGDQELVEARTGVVAGIANEVCEVVEQLGKVLVIVDTNTGPELRFDGPDVDSVLSDNTVVGGTVLQSPEEIRVLVGIGLDDLAGAQDNLVFNDVLGTDAVHVGKEGNATYETDTLLVHENTQLERNRTYLLIRTLRLRHRYPVLR